jgi:EAL domain-containing protein (putative c-di-GMP-specific phosphodiesterase class I)
MVKSLETLHGRLEQQVHSDVVTHLLNEKAFAEQVEQALALARQERESQVVAFVEVHEPAAVQQLPEAEREQRLRDRAARFRSDLPPEAQAARLGENRFGVLLRDYSQGRGFAAIEKVLRSLEVTDEDAVAAGSAKARAGLVPFSTEPVSADQVLKSAQAALALAQAPGSAPIRIVHVDEDGDTGVRVSSRLGEHLRLALDNDRLRLALQRIVPQAQGTSPSQLPTHVELVPSMQLPGGTRVSARALRAAAEQLQRTADLDRWLVRAAMRWVVDNPERLPAGGMCIIVLTPESLRDPGTATFIGEEFINTAAPPGRFCFEVTEAPGAEASLEVSELVNAMREYGCRFLYGDFGGEASSFTRVATLKVNLVRIGRMATRDIANDKGDAALVKSAVEMAHFFGMPAIADCIDSKAALAKSKELGIEYAQGAAVSPVELAV